MEYIALFFTHSGAIRYDKYIKAKGLKNELMPVPRKISSSCGVGAKFFYEGNIDELITEDIESLHRVNGKEYELLFKEE